MSPHNLRLARRQFVITTQSDLRAAFWATLTADRSDLAHCYGGPSKRQNAYPADVRAAWVDFVDANQRDGTISEALASRATL